MKLTPDEKKVLDSLAAAWNLYSKLPVQHPMESAEFCDGIHRCQDLLAMRIARRVDPDNFITFK